MSPQEAFDAREGAYKSTSEIWKRRGSDNHQQCHTVAHNRVAFVRLVSDAVVMGERDPTTTADLLQPDFVCGICREVIRMPFYREALCSENRWKLLPEITIGEIDKAQAARS